MKNYFLQAVNGIVRNKSRAALTMLGIMIGIAAVILVFSAGEGFRSYLRYQVELFGSNTLSIETVLPATTRARSGRTEGEGAGSNLENSVANSAIPVTTFKNRDIEDIKKLDNVRNAYGAVMTQAKVSRDGVSKNVFVFGAHASRFDIDKGRLASGRFYTEAEDDALLQKAILGNKLSADLFDGDDPLGKLVRLGTYNFEVIGVYEPRGGLGATDDDQIFIPLSVLQKKFLGIDYLHFGIVDLYDNSLAEVTALYVADVLRQNHGIGDPARDDFSVKTQAQNLGIFNTILSAVTFLLSAIASISLLVGGVGVMNVMYVAVTERVPEIGLKKALGARPRDILFEFLLEALLLALLGGMAGMILGGALSFATAVVMRKVGLVWEFSIPLSGVLFSLSVSAAVGIIFGVFPARSASHLDPIEALNKE